MEQELKREILRYVKAIVIDWEWEYHKHETTRFRKKDTTQRRRKNKKFEFFNLCNCSIKLQFTACFLRIIRP